MQFKFQEESHCYSVKVMSSVNRNNVIQVQSCPDCDAPAAGSPTTVINSYYESHFISSNEPERNSRSLISSKTLETRISKEIKCYYCQPTLKTD